MFDLGMADNAAGADGAERPDEAVHHLGAGPNDGGAPDTTAHEAGAGLDIRVKGLLWGGGFEWETVVFDVTPISYAQCGLYTQFHRREEDVYGNIAYLFRNKYGSEPPFRNIPNKYLLDERIFPPRT